MRAMLKAVKIDSYLVSIYSYVQSFGVVAYLVFLALGVVLGG